MPSRRDILRGAAGMAALAAGGAAPLRAQTPRGAVEWSAREVTAAEAATVVGIIRDPRRWLCRELTGCTGDDPARVTRRQAGAISRAEEAPELLHVAAFAGDGSAGPGVYIAAARSSEASPLQIIETVDCHIDDQLTDLEAATAFRIAAIETLRIAAERGYTHHIYTHPGADEPRLTFAPWRWRDWSDITVTALPSDQGTYAWRVSGPIAAFVRAYAALPATAAV